MNSPLEEELFNKYTYVLGIDEVGRGPWAGPMLIAGTLITVDSLTNPPLVDDSKKFNERQRYELAKEISIWAKTEISSIDSNYIDRNGLTKSLTTGCERLISKFRKNYELSRENTIIIQDGKISYLGKYSESFNTEVHVKADSKSLAVAASSIVAKHKRDNIMKNYSLIYPEYGFESNMGYGTTSHKLAIEKHGFTPIHRTSWSIGNKKSAP